MNHAFKKNTRIEHFSKRMHYDMVQSWWVEKKEVPPTIDMMPEESSFVMFHGAMPWIVVTVYLLNTNEFAMVDNLIANPFINAPNRKDAISELNDFLKSWAKNLGIKKLFCMAGKESLAKRYEELGYIPTMRNVTTFIQNT